MNHSREPWANDPTDPEDIRDAKGRLVHGVSPYEPIALDEDDAKRIVACVNACKDIPTALLEQIVRERGSILRDVKEFGVCAGSTLVLDALLWAGNEDLEKEWG